MISPPVSSPRELLLLSCLFGDYKFIPEIRLCPCSPKGEEAEAGCRSGQETFWLASGEQSSATEWWHHTAILSRALWTLSHPQVGGMQGSEFNPLWADWEPTEVTLLCAADFGFTGFHTQCIFGHENFFFFWYKQCLFIEVTINKHYIRTWERV